MRARVLWSRWKEIAHRLASVQARTVLGLMYFTLLLPFAMLIRFHSRPLRAAGWQKHDTSDTAESAAARRQF